MKRWVLVLPLLLGCMKQQQGGVRDVSVEQVSEWVNAKSALVLDANVEDFRRANGVVPGAVLLENYLDWDPPTVLGADKTRQLVFYCTSKT